MIKCDTSLITKMMMKTIILATQTSASMKTIVRTLHLIKMMMI